MNIKKILFFILLLLFTPELVLSCGPAVLDEIRALVQQHSIFPVDQEVLDTLTCKKLPSALKRIDPYAKWFSAKKYHGLKNKSEQVGVGAILIRHKNRYYLLPYKNGPLYKRGIKNRVRLLAINNKKVSGMKYMQVWKEFLGPVNSLVKLTLMNKGKKRSFYVVRSYYTPSSLEVYKEKDKVIIRLLRFKTRETRAFLESELQNITQNDTLIIDLRACSGGDLYEALDCAALFLKPSQEMVKLVDADGNEEVVKAPASLALFDYNIKILIDSDTASAAEIFGGILAYYGVATLAGKPTMGKCVSQKDFFLSDGSVLRLSNLKIFFPDGSTCQGKGLKPNAY